MNKIILMMSAALVATSGAGLAQTQSQSQSQSNGQKVDRKAPDYVRCIRRTETGSLVKRYKTCKTNAEWDRLDAQQQTEAQGLVERGRSGINPIPGG